MKSARSASTRDALPLPAVSRSTSASVAMPSTARSTSVSGSASRSIIGDGAVRAPGARISSDSGCSSVTSSVSGYAVATPFATSSNVDAGCGKVSSWLRAPRRNTASP